jgi:hypothetical protein
MEKDMTPLIWTCVYGGDDYFNILRISLESLVKYGSYKRSICIFSDRDQQQTLQYVPTEMWAWTIVLPFPKEANLSARYECASHLPKDYDLYLYVDTDIIYDASIWPMLYDIKNSKKLCFTSEKHFYPDLQKKIGELRNTSTYNSEWFGLGVALQDGTLDDCYIPIINSGVIGSNDLNELVTVCCDIKAMLKRIDPNYIKEFGDQPVTNYVIIRYGCETNITRYIHFTTSSPPELNVRKGIGLRGMVHFLWAGSLKYAEMSQYLDLLERMGLDATRG